MDAKRISIVSGTALLALTAAASAGPMSVASSQIVTPPIPIEQVHNYHRHHHRHHGWHHHRYRHHGWHHHRYHHHSWRHHSYWNPAAAAAGTAFGLATVPFALATGGWPYYYGYPYYYY